MVHPSTVAVAAAAATCAALWLRRRKLHRSPPLEYSFHAFMDDSLSHPVWGYYSSGRIEFGESKQTADFTTFPISMRPFFGAILADRLHSLWLATNVSTNDATNDASTFVVVELGAGTGVLAHDVLLRIREAWPRMYESLLYVIGEHSVPHHTLLCTMLALACRW
eukprot:Transcript_14763.p1 GENE.Transcript_14763~~Transcript_14763.p1  ORF type:complete len:165 (-),score=39.48 Transcript_14763:176-670(-)